MGMLMTPVLLVLDRPCIKYFCYMISTFSLIVYRRLHIIVMKLLSKGSGGFHKPHDDCYYAGP